MQHRNFEAVIFDMDGVVIDTRKPIEAFWREMAGRHGVEISTETMELKIHGCPARATADLLFPALTKDEKDALSRECEDFEAGLRYEEMKGVKKLLTDLSGFNVPTALVTSSLPPKVENVLAQLGLEGKFRTIVTANLVERGKPDPACYLLAAQKLEKSPQNCIAFEDAASGLKAVRGAGMFAVGVGGKVQEEILRQAGAQIVIPNFANVQVGKKAAGQYLLKVDQDNSFAVSGVGKE